jgi:hypothetical protein
MLPHTALGCPECGIDRWFDVEPTEIKDANS